MINEIKGQPVSFSDEYCGDYCLTLANNAICGDYIDNPTMMGNPITDWTLSAGAQVVERVFLTDGASTATFTDSVTIPAGDYKLYYKFGHGAIDITFTLTITNGPTAVTVFDTSLGDAPGGVYEMTLTGASARTVTATITSALATQLIGASYFYICKADALTPETDFCFQMPLFNGGSELLGASTVDLDAVITDTHTPGTPGTNGVVGSVSGVCGNSRIDTYDNIHLGLTNNEDGYYFIQYEIETGSITYSAYDGVSQQIRLQYDVNAGTGESYVDITEDTFSGGFKTQDEFAPQAGDSCLVTLVSTYEDDGTGTCYVSYTMGVLNSSAWKMWQEDTFTGVDDTFYRLKFKNNNTTGTTVKIYDSASALIFESNSDGVLFDKVFDTGTLPAGKTVTIRYEFDEFIDTESADWYDSILTEATLYKQCKYEVDLEETDDTTVLTLAEDHATTTEESETVSYNQNIEYCLDVNLVTPETYHFRATDQCDTTNSYTSNDIFVCGGSCEGLNQFSYTPTAAKCIGNDVLDYIAYPSTQFFWLKLDLQDVTMDDERVAYRQSDGFWNVPYAINQSAESLQVWPVPVFIRRAIANGMQDTFEIDGVEYQKVEEDDYSLQFTARHENAMRIVVAKVGDFSISRNA